MQLISRIFVWAITTPFSSLPRIVLPKMIFWLPKKSEKMERVSFLFALKAIRENCLKNLEEVNNFRYHGDEREVVYLISNHHPDKWDFHRLTEAIIDSLPFNQKQSLTLTLTNLSTEMLERKAQFLKGTLYIQKGQNNPKRALLGSNLTAEGLF